MPWLTAVQQHAPVMPHRSQRLEMSQPKLRSRHAPFQGESASQQGLRVAYLFLLVLQHVLELGQLFVLIPFNAFGFIAQPAGVILLQALDGLLLLLLQALHFLVVLALLGLNTGGSRCNESDNIARTSCHCE